MPIKKDATGKRWVEMEFLVPGTPEQVWQAMATGPGLAAWFVKGEIEPRVGGIYRLHWGEGIVTTGEVTAWDPPHSISHVSRDFAPNAPPLATEITIGRSGDGCVVRLVHSLFASSDEWDNQIEGAENGWPGFFAILRVYLEHFAGASAASFIAMTSANADAPTAWSRLNKTLGLTSAKVGARCTATSGPESWSGIVGHIHRDAQQQYVLLRLDTPSPGTALVGTADAANLGATAGTAVSVCRYFYGDDAAARAAEGEARWRDWLTQTFGTQSITEA